MFGFDLGRGCSVDAGLSSNLGWTIYYPDHFAWSLYAFNTTVQITWCLKHIIFSDHCHRFLWFLLQNMPGVFVYSLSQCKEPSDYLKVREKLTQFIQQKYYKELGSLSFPEVMFPSSDLRKPDAPNSRTFTTKLYGKELNCTNEIERLTSRRSRRNRRAGGEELLERKICPWDVLVEYDSLRLPASIAKARCVCHECLLATRRSRNTKGTHKPACTEINSVMPVIRKSCVSSVYVYRVELEPVPVGCTCQMIWNRFYIMYCVVLLRIVLSLLYWLHLAVGWAVSNAGKTMAPKQWPFALFYYYLNVKEHMLRCLFWS